MDRVLPITVLTGYLGSGKTTLLNRILSESNGTRTAVILNAFEEVGLDPQLVGPNTDGPSTDVTEIVQANNGCICCTVRDDLVGTIKRLLAKRDLAGPDRIVIEASGLADPAALIRSFYLDEQIRTQTRIDAVVTIVDLRHIIGHWNTREACEQIVFGDVILLNKADLVSEPELFAVRDRIRRMNPYARMHVTKHCDMPLAQIMDVSAFSLSRALTIDSQLLDDTAHAHDEEVSAVCVAREGVVDVPRLTRFLHAFGQECAADLFRVKGIMNVTGDRKRLVVQGMHTWLETQPGSAWQPQEPRTNRLVLIGRALDRPSLEQAFAACISPPAEAARPHA